MSFVVIVCISGRPCMARAARPNVVAKQKGIENQERPPIIYPGRVAEGSAVMAFWKSWTSIVVPKTAHLIT